jgi:hypothetical protein
VVRQVLAHYFLPPAAQLLQVLQVRLAVQALHQQLCEVHLQHQVAQGVQLHLAALAAEEELVRLMALAVEGVMQQIMRIVQAEVVGLVVMEEMPIMQAEQFLLEVVGCLPVLAVHQQVDLGVVVELPV